MSEDFLKSMESFLNTVQEELSNKLINLNSRLDKLTEANKNLIKDYREKESDILKQNNKFNPYHRILDLEEQLLLEKRKISFLEKEIGLYKQSSFSGRDTSNLLTTETADYILNHLKISLKELISTLDIKSNTDFQKRKEIEQLNIVEKSYITETEEQSIDERITTGSETIKIFEDYNRMKKDFSLLLEEKKRINELNANLQRELSYRKQEVAALQKTIKEGELQAEILKNENEKIKKEIFEYKSSLENFSQRSHQRILELEKDVRESREIESNEDQYKKELKDLRNTLSQRKQEIKELRKMLNGASQLESADVISDNESSKDNSSLEKTIEEKNLLISNLSSEMKELEHLKDKYSDLESKLKKIIIEGKRLGLEESLNVEDQLDQFKLLVKVSERVYAPKGYLTVLKYLSNNPGWVDLHYLSKQININPGVVHNILLELVDLNLAKIDEENNKAQVQTQDSSV